MCWLGFHRWGQWITTKTYQGGKLSDLEIAPQPPLPDYWRINDKGWLECLLPDGTWVTPDCGWRCAKCDACIGCIKKQYLEPIWGPAEFVCENTGGHHVVEESE